MCGSLDTSLRVLIEAEDVRERWGQLRKAKSPRDLYDVVYKYMYYLNC